MTVDSGQRWHRDGGAERRRLSGVVGRIGRWLAGRTTGQDAATAHPAAATTPASGPGLTPADDMTPTDVMSPAGDAGPPGPGATVPAGGSGEVVSGGARSWPGPAWAFRIASAATAGVAVTSVLVRSVTGAGSALTLIVVALVIALGLDPAVTALTRRGMRRSIAVAVVALAFLAVIAGFFAAVVPPIAAQGQQLVANAPDYLRRLQDHSSLLGRLDDRYHVLARVQQYVTSGGNALFSDIVGLGAAVFGAVASALTVLILTVYFLAGLPGIKRTLLRSVPRSRRPRATELTDEIARRVGGYVLGNIVTSVIAGVGTLVFLEIVGVPYPLALGLFVALLDLVPVIGSTIAGVVVTLVALTVSVPVAIATLAYYVAYRLAEDYLLVPRIMRRTVNVPPVVTIVALLIGGALLGILGALLAIPAAAVVELLLTELVWPRLDRT
jgi:predicted PurR-regulated permease PerM